MSLLLCTIYLPEYNQNWGADYVAVLAPVFIVAAVCGVLLLGGIIRISIGNRCGGRLGLSGRLSRSLHRGLQGGYASTRLLSVLNGVVKARFYRVGRLIKRILKYAKAFVRRGVDIGLGLINVTKVLCEGR